MKTLIFPLSLVFLFLWACNTKEKIMPPVADKNPTELTNHGESRTDNYFWMNDREDPKVIEYLEAENAYTDAVMEHTKPIQGKLYEEIKSKIKQEDESVPYKKNGYYYYQRTVPEKEYYLYCRKKGSLDTDEEVVLDVNKMAEGYDFYQLGGASVSPDNKIVAFGVDTVSRRKYTIHFKILETGEIFDDAIPLTTGSSVWANDNKTVYYVLKDDVTLRSEKIMKHILGTPVENDVEVFYEEDETFSTFIYKTKSNKYLIIGSESTLTSEYRFLDANNPRGEFKIIQPRTRGLEYAVDHFGDYFYIRTNLNALNFKLVRTPVSETEKENWEEVIPHRKDVYFSDFDIFKDDLVVSERKEGITQLRVMPWNGDEYYIDFDEEVYTVGSDINYDFDTDIFRFSYSSLTTPHSVFDFNMKNKERKLLKQTEVLGGFNKDDYETRRIYATAMDGTKIPISLVYKKGLEKDGTNPALIYGYGSYGYTIDPTFRLSILPLLDRGFVYAIAHIRGGQINGRAWYEDGKLLNKMNTFTDFNDCAQFLIDEGYTNPDKLFANGGSAGGLLMGAVVNLRPDLYKGVIADVPFVDVVTTMLDESIPLTTSEFDEWGNPKIEKYYYYMMSYSPYDNVAKKDYPAMMVTTGLHDSQVQYWEPTKWVAKLRDLKTDDNLLIFHVNMDYGHGGASGRFQWIENIALEYAFIFDQLGMNE
ncbi:prolyl oligopeptidase family serine peptidase [Maribellus comscasis]|uniref:Proline-specific endopeptidase n=1 Tax=Maribellus comscasis TaxID=2681766 RepID=A0A6I6JW89_9BACT|nr:S9 family peptidase [Maribellus comscasis]QGY47425.1 prolyl oligopeptidase family serine peptidase [Maribellus comscasis]